MTAILWAALVLTLIALAWNHATRTNMPKGGDEWVGKITRLGFGDWDAVVQRAGVDYARHSCCMTKIGARLWVAAKLRHVRQPSSAHEDEIR